MLRQIARPYLVVAALCVGLISAHAQTSPAPAAPPVTIAPSGPATPADPKTSSGPAEDNAPDASAVTAVTLEARPTVALSGSAEWDDGLRSIMDSFDKIRAEMGKAGIQQGGRPLAVFIETDDKGFRYEAMIPVVSAPAPGVTFGQGIRAAASPGGKTMKFEHRGAYDEIDTTYEAITAYLDEKGLDAQNLFVEEYLNTPTGADDQDLEADIYVFLK